MPKRPVPARAKVTFTHPDKIYFPGSGTTKAEIIRYYLEAARWLLPHLEDRPVTLIRFPNGYGGESFYEKNAPAHTPAWIKTHRVPRRRHEGTINYILINDAETLAWCVNLGAIELHPFLHRVPDLERPTHVAFDLDPGEGADLLTCAEVAFRLREVLRDLGLEAWPKVTGSKGLQVYVPLNTPVTYDLTSPFARTVAELLERELPDLVVSNMSKALRKKRVLIDWSQNSASKTTVTVYGVRAKRDRPYVSMPVEWSELEEAKDRRDLDALFFSPEAALERLHEAGDLFAPVLTKRQRLPEAFAEAVAPVRRTTPRRSGGTSEAAALKEYARKRDFSRTAEPPPHAGKIKRGERARFVIQKHAASHLHYDFRLEIDGTLKSWAVPKGLPTELEVKRSAFETEDHPLEYLDFEGTIPKGQYGGGTVMVWDIGTFDVLSGNHGKGSLRVALHGKKLKGEWQLYRIRREADGKNVWLVEKRGAALPAISARRDDTSVLSRRSMAQIAEANDAQWQSNREGASGGGLVKPAAEKPKAPAKRRPRSGRAVPKSSAHRRRRPSAAGGRKRQKA